CACIACRRRPAAGMVRTTSHIMMSRRAHDRPTIRFERLMTASAPAPHDGAPPARGEPWGFWTTTAYGLAAIAAWFAAQLSAAFLVLAGLGVGSEASDFEVQTLASHALTIAVA